MKAFVIPHPGAHVVELAEVPVPKIDADELLVRVRAVGVGIHDSYFLPNDAKYPFPIGIEAAGVIEEIGSEVRGHRPEERIAFVSSMQPKGGTWAEYVAVKATSLIMPIPTGLGFVEAAAIPVAGNTALKALGALATAPVDGRSSLLVARGRSARSPSNLHANADGTLPHPRRNPITTTCFRSARTR